MKSTIIVFFAVVLLGMTSCNKQLSPLLNNPSTPTTAAADPDLYLNNLQINFKLFYKDASDFTDAMVRQEILFGPTYYNAHVPSDFDELWNTAYMSVFLTANTMIPLAESKGEYTHAGIAQVLKAYTMFTLVDLFGDVPFSQADLGLTNTNPLVDKGAAIYDSALTLLDSAIANLAKKASAAPSNDIFYGSKKTPATYWTTLAKTLKLKAYVTTRLVDNTVAAKITALATENDLINTADQDFVFAYSTHNSSPDSRSSHYVTNYGTDAGAGDYIGTYFMWALNNEKSMQDPRTRYYLYRQIDDITVTNDTRLPNLAQKQFAIPCLYRTSPYPAGTCYCIVDNSYWGRDHGNNEGIPPDNSLRTTWGVYAGGAFDANQDLPTGQSGGHEKGAGGNGVNPIWLSSYTNFLLAEAALTLGTPGDPQTLMLAGVDASFNKVAGFANSIGYTLPTTDTSKMITPFKQQKYKGIVTGLYQNAATTDAKLNVIEKEYYLSAWGNGLEPFNTYRRTGKPDNMQPMLGNSPGLFIRSFFYASVYVNYNKSAVQKTATNVKVFWDTNPDNFVY